VAEQRRDDPGGTVEHVEQPGSARRAFNRLMGDDYHPAFSGGGECAFQPPHLSAVDDPARAPVAADEIEHDQPHAPAEVDCVIESGAGPAKS
jgi:hypothetical protein